MAENIFSSTTSEPTPSSGAFTGYNVVIQVLGEDIAKAERLTADVSNNIRQQYVVGSRTPLNIETGLSIRGTIRMLYVNTGLLRLVLGNESSLIDPYPMDITRDTVEGWMGNSITTPAFASPNDYFRLPIMTISCSFNTEHLGSITAHSLDFLNAKFDSFSLSIDANNVILQDVAFYAEQLRPVIQS